MTNSNGVRKVIGKRAGKRSAAISSKETAVEWIELFPHGISLATGMTRPVLILKDQAEVEVLPVWIQPLDAGVALAELSQGSGASPHTVTRRLLEMLDQRLESCVLDELIGHHQFVQLTFRGPTGVQHMRVRADEAMSFCLQGRARFFSTKAFMARCRDLDSDIAQMEHNLAQGQLPGLQSEIENSSKKHPYVM